MNSQPEVFKTSMIINKVFQGFIVGFKVLWINDSMHHKTSLFFFHQK